MATRDTLQEWEDLIPTRSGHQLDSSSTCHGLDGRDRPGKIKISFRDPGFTNCEGLMQIIKPESKRKVLFGRRITEKQKNLPMFTRRQAAFTIHYYFFFFFKRHNVQGRAMSMNDSLNIVLALAKAPEADLLEGFHHRQKCFGPLSFRSSSPQGAEEPLEVERIGPSRFGRPAAKLF